MVETTKKKCCSVVDGFLQGILDNCFVYEYSIFCLSNSSYLNCCRIYKALENMMVPILFMCEYDTQ